MVIRAHAWQPTNLAMLSKARISSSIVLRNRNSHPTALPLFRLVYGLGNVLFGMSKKWGSTSELRKPLAYMILDCLFTDVKSLRDLPLRETVNLLERENFSATDRKLLDCQTIGMEESFCFNTIF